MYGAESFDTKKVHKDRHVVQKSGVADVNEHVFRNDCVLCGDLLLLEWLAGCWSSVTFVEKPSDVMQSSGKVAATMKNKGFTCEASDAD